MRGHLWLGYFHQSEEPCEIWEQCFPLTRSQNCSAILRLRLHKQTGTCNLSLEQLHRGMGGNFKVKISTPRGNFYLQRFIVCRQSLCLPDMLYVLLNSFGFTLAKSIIVLQFNMVSLVAAAYSNFISLPTTFTSLKTEDLYAFEGCSAVCWKF